MSLLLEVLVGLAVGCHIATWGMYKDAIHEGFTLGKYTRSILVGVALVTLTVYWIAAPLLGLRDGLPLWAR